MTGPAQNANATQASISAPTGPASTRRKRGVTESSELQNRRMPVRPSAIMPARPETSTPVTSIQAATEGLSVAEVCKAADSNENFATKPDKGGRPVTSRERKSVAEGRSVELVGWRWMTERQVH